MNRPAPYYASAGYRHGMLVRCALADLCAAVLWLVKLAAVMAAMLCPYAAAYLFNLYL